MTTEQIKEAIAETNRDQDVCRLREVQQRYRFALHQQEVLERRVAHNQTQIARDRKELDILAVAIAKAEAGDASLLPELPQPQVAECKEHRPDRGHHCEKQASLHILVGGDRC